MLFDQSHHMDELIVEGPDAARFLEGLAINSFANFGTNRAKHFVPVSPDGYVIGDMIFFREQEDRSSWSAARRPRTGSSTTPRLGRHNVQV